ncbi:helix-turn-helix domain-containing protein [Secundilactobacillus kimchicus]|nr:helix-turn-helix domain-containing protein [Secundilactobacillus kimchicus]
MIQRDIEREFNVQRSTMTMILQRMEKKSVDSAGFCAPRCQAKAGYFNG